MSVEAAVAKLQAQQESMGSDIGDMKAALTSIAASLRDLSGIEQRQISLAESINRAHSRMDDMQEILKEEVKGHEKRLQAIEIALAKNHWIERIIMAAVMGIIGLWIKGGI